MSPTATLLMIGTLLAACLTCAADASGAPNGPTCEPEILVLPGLEGQESTFIRGLSDQGWAVGSSSVMQPNSDWEWYSTAVVWRDGAVIDLGTGGGVRPDGDVISSYAVALNEMGVIVGQRARLRPEGSFSFKRVSSHAWMWRDGDTTRLATGRTRPRASVSALNDRGVAVGEVAATGWRSSRPAMWRYGKQIRLPIPRGAAGGASDINNKGLVIGWVRSASGGSRLWYWQLGGPSGPLNEPASYGSNYLLAVDNRDRILGHGWAPDEGAHALLWRGPESRPSRLGGYALANTSDMNDDGDLTGYRGGWRGVGLSAWVSNLQDEKVHSLPVPKPFSWGNMSGIGVIRGVTWFAPNGGISVAGYGHSYDAEGSSISRAVIWTCTDIY
jgi:hypothetical protein